MTSEINTSLLISIAVCVLRASSKQFHIFLFGVLISVSLYLITACLRLLFLSYCFCVPAVYHACSATVRLFEPVILLKPRPSEQSLLVSSLPKSHLSHAVLVELFIVTCLISIGVNSQHKAEIAEIVREHKYRHAVCIYAPLDFLVVAFI